MWERILTLVPYLLVAAALTFCLTGLVRQFALRLGIVSKPRARDMHKTPIPRLGGAAIIISFTAVFIAAQLLSPRILWFTDELRLGLDRQALGVLMGVIVLLVFGIWDDYRNLNPRQQLIGQFLAAGCIVAAGIGITSITNPFVPGSTISLEQVTIPLFNLGTHLATVTLWSDIFTIVFLVAMMNVMNWFDGLDGLAGGVTAIASLLLAVLSVMVGSPVGIIAMLVILAGTMLGFLPWNWYPARIFMGTSGSTFLGFILGVAAIISGGKIATVLLILGVPVLDAVWVIVNRARKHQPVFAADRTHVHHRLVDAGVPIPLSVLLLYLMASIFGGLALLYNDPAVKMALAILLIGLMGVFSVCTTSICEKLKLKNES